MALSKRTEIILFLMICLIAIGLRFYHIDHNSLWMDEVSQVSKQYQAKSISQIIKFATYQNQPPLDYIIGYFIAQFVDFSELSARFPSFIFGSGLIIICYLFTRKLFNPWTAIISTVIFSLSTTLIYFSQEARPYSIFLFFLIALLATFFSIIDSNEEKTTPWFICTLLSALTLITRGMAPVTALISLNISYALALLFTIIEKKNLVLPFTFNMLRNLLISTIVAGISFMPFFLKVWDQSHYYVNEKAAVNNITWSLIEPLQLLVTSKLPYNLGNMTHFCLVGFLLGIFFIIKQRHNKPSHFILLLYCILEPIISIYLYYIIVDVSVAKPKSNYFIQSIIPIIIISSYGYTRSLELLLRNIDIKKQFLLYTILVIVILNLSIPQLPVYYSKPKADYRGAVKYLKTVFNNQDVAIYDTFRPFGAWEPRLYGRGVYYGKQLKIRQYNWKNWLVQLENKFDINGRLFLFLHAGKANSSHYFTNSDIFIEKNFEQMTIIYAKDKSLSLTKTTLLYIDEMLNFFPDNSSKVDLYLAKAKLLCPSSTNKVRENIVLAESFLKGKKLDFQCR